MKHRNQIPITLHHCNEKKKPYYVCQQKQLKLFKTEHHHDV